jgi:cell division protein FtsB
LAKIVTFKARCDNEHTGIEKRTRKAGQRMMIKVILQKQMRIFRLLRNKYFITVLALIAWLFFFDKNDVFTQYELIQKCEKLEKEKEYYLTEISNNKANLNELRTNPRSLETFSREKYLMKKDNEDVYILVTR